MPNKKYLRKIYGTIQISWAMKPVFVRKENVSYIQHFSNVFFLRTPSLQSNMMKDFLPYTKYWSTRPTYTRPIVITVFTRTYVRPKFSNSRQWDCGLAEWIIGNSFLIKSYVFTYGMLFEFQLYFADPGGWWYPGRLVQKPHQWRGPGETPGIGNEFICIYKLVPVTRIDPLDLPTLTTESDYYICRTCTSVLLFKIKVI